MTIPIIIGPNKTKNRSFRSRFFTPNIGMYYPAKVLSDKTLLYEKTLFYEIFTENFNKKWFYVGFVLLCLAVVFL